jgi:hypothetical protein
MMWINATRIRDQASLILASCKSGCAAIFGQLSLNDGANAQTAFDGALIPR